MSEVVEDCIKNQYPSVKSPKNTQFAGLCDTYK